MKIVDGVGGAIEHINRHGSHHTEAIVTEDEAAAERFLNEIDAGILLVNASTQFADGGEFGMGAEIGISTGKLHARGPVGAEQLTSYKYIVRGTGQVRPLTRAVALPGRRIGILGGSFNPAHDGHREISLWALDRLALDRVWWLVSPQNPLKAEAGMAPFAERFASAQSVARHPRIEVTDIEARLGSRYTAQTLPTPRPPVSEPPVRLADGRRQPDPDRPLAALATDISHGSHCRFLASFLFYESIGRQSGAALRKGPFPRRKSAGIGRSGAAGMGLHPRPCQPRIGHGNSGPDQEDCHGRCDSANGRAPGEA